MKNSLFIMMGILVSSAFAETDMHRLIWNDDPATTVTIAWRQLSDEAIVYYDVVDYGKEAASYGNLQSFTRKNNHLDLNTHFAELKMLLPDRKYYFLIADGDSVSRRYYFKTAPDQAADFTFIAGGDTKSSDQRVRPGNPAKKTAYDYGRMSNRMVAKVRPLFVLFVGDFTSNSDKGARWVEWFNDWNEDTCSLDGRMYPIIPVHGNHENPNGLTDLKNLFDTPESVYYTIDFCENLLRVFVLNSELSSKQLERIIPELEQRWQAQTSWLEDTLKNSRSFKYRAAMYHKPMRPHTKKKHTPEQVYSDWAPLFAKYRLNLSFDGDSHMHKITYPVIPDSAGEDGFRRDDKKGTMYIGEGSWGATPRVADVERDWTMSLGSFNQFKLIHVRDKKFLIHTVITDNEADVDSLQEGHEFEFPEGIKLFDTPGMGTAIKYPFKK
ncbi:MAG: fibronectin type III domain-containing protein [Pontiella sp.]